MCNITSLDNQLATLQHGIKPVYITDNSAGQRLVNDFTHSLVEHIAKMQIIEGTEVVLTA